MDEIKPPATGDRNGLIRGITNLDEELGVSRALRKALSMSGLDDVACTNPTTILLRLDGRVIEAVLMPLIFALSIQEHELGAATRGGSENCIAKTPSLPELAALIKTALRRVELREADAPRRSRSGKLNWTQSGGPSAKATIFSICLRRSSICFTI